MFDLETKIQEWRKQMLTAGVKSPVPLDELESHLRERIDFLKVGLPEAGAFQTAAKELGDGKILKKEFSKGRIFWRLRNNPTALNILGLWFVLGGLNNLSQLVWLWHADWPWDDKSILYWSLAISAIGSLQFPVGIGLLCRGKFWRFCALAFCGLCTISPIWDIAIKFYAPQGWDAPGLYFILMGVLVPMKFSLSIDYLNICLLVCAVYVLAMSSVKNLFRPAATN